MPGGRIVVTIRPTCTKGQIVPTIRPLHLSPCLLCENVILIPKPLGPKCNSPPLGRLYATLVRHQACLQGEEALGLRYKKSPLLRPPDLVVHPRFQERRDESLAPREGALAARERGDHGLVGGVRLGHVLAVAVGEVAAGDRLQTVHAH